MASPGKETLRINSLDNGLLMCLDHHKGYDTFRFSIHPEVSLIKFARLPSYWFT